MRKNYAACLKEFIVEKKLNSSGAFFTKDELFSWFSRQYPAMGDIENQLLKKTTNYKARGQWKPRAGADDIFFQLDESRFRLFQQEKDPAPFYDTEQPRQAGRVVNTSADSERQPYNYCNCQSLFGYAKNVHERSGGMCQLCGCGSGSDVDFDLWRQMTVEHLIGKSQGGYLNQIRESIRKRFPELPVPEQEALAASLDQMNTVTACQFCNSTTSQSLHTRSMTSLISETTGTPDNTLRAVENELTLVMGRKRADIQWKIQSVKVAFEREIKPALIKRRAGTPAEKQSGGREDS